jgi:hypothetical protein
LAPEMPKRNTQLGILDANSHNIDELLASLENDNELLEFELLDDSHEDLADLLSPASTHSNSRAAINVLSNNAASRDEQVFQAVLNCLNQDSFTRHFDPLTVVDIREQLLAHKDQILKSV